MAVTDPIADYLTRIRNAQMAGHHVVEIPSSNLKKKLTEKNEKHLNSWRWFICFFDD
jgi:ribosomal protein S8